MARTKGDLAMSFSFEPTNQGPLDARVVVNTQADLIDMDSWKDKNYYIGMVVSVKEDCSLWVMKDPSLLPSLTAWKRILQGENDSDIVVVDNLTTESSKDALSAGQGKVLADKLEELEQKTSKVSWWEEDEHPIVEEDEEQKQLLEE